MPNIAHNETTGRKIITRNHNWSGSGLAAEIIMVAGYFGFETAMYGMEAALGSVVFNIIQGRVAIVLAIPLTFMIGIKKRI